MKEIYNQRVGQILDIYIQRTGIKWEDIKLLILKNKYALSLLEEDYVEFANAYQAANKLIGITLMRDVSDSDLKDKINYDEEDCKIIELLKDDKFEFIKPPNYLEKFKNYIPSLKSENKITIMTDLEDIAKRIKENLIDIDINTKQIYKSNRLIPYAKGNFVFHHVLPEEKQNSSIKGNRESHSY